MRTILISLCAIVLLITACKPSGNSGGTPTPSTGGQGAGLVVAANGLNPAERANFYHLAEGSELYPYSWMKALQTPAGKPFLENTERFGLLSDPNDPDGLPIGLTKASRPGVPLGEMVGVNCAACHVGELSHNNQSFRVDGAQNLFDLVAFDLELFTDSEATVKDPNKLFAFLVRWWDQGHDAAPTEPTMVQPSIGAKIAQHPSVPSPTDATRKLLARHKSLDDLRNAGPLEKSLADEFAAIVARHEAAPVKTAEIAPTGASTVVYKAAAKKVAQKAAGPNGIFAASKSAVERETSVAGIFGDVERYVALMYSYIDLLKSLANTAGSGAAPAGGYGRVDAFGGARNLLFPKDAQPSTAPVSYPYLWGFEKIAWFHYAANTNSTRAKHRTGTWPRRLL